MIEPGVVILMVGELVNVFEGVNVFVFVLVLLGGACVLVANGGEVLVAVGLKVDVKVAFSVEVSAKIANPASNSVLVGEGVAVIVSLPKAAPPNTIAVGVRFAFPFLPWLMPYHPPAAARTTNTAIKGITGNLVIFFSPCFSFEMTGFGVPAGLGELILC